MKSPARSFTCCAGIALMLALASCDTTDNNSTTTTAATTTTKKKDETKPKKPVTTMRDVNGDVSFQAFLNRLRQAVAAKEVNVLASMMTANFGYHLNPDKEGDGVFQYWDQNNVWPELQLVMRERFVPFGEQADGFMVAPPEFAAGSDHFTGYRAGIRLVNGGWKFAYFVNGD